MFGHGVSLFNLEGTDAESGSPSGQKGAPAKREFCGEEEEATFG